MQTLIHADIFFFVSTIALAVVSVALVITLFYLIRILRNVRDISEKVREEGLRIIKDINDLRGSLREEGTKWKGVAEAMTRFVSHISGNRPKASRKKRSSVDEG